MSFVADFSVGGLAWSNHVSHAFGLLTASREHTEHTKFHGKNTEYRFAYGKHRKPKEIGISKW
ncbi:hypothetical protein McpCs1_11870 [Methanocorpusculaceae archaeon Cs1]|uniref:Uncharacterized protein n=1 Tax=Methanorbis rubei TaxID=3028300 RepID=A0AAE4MGN7_9EURY|nr:hypothetical protein [Methanocorpusculaceae archaeon Cs1]